MFQKKQQQCENLYKKMYNVIRLKQNDSLIMIFDVHWDQNQKLLSLGDVALFDEEVIDFARLVDVNLDQRSGLCQPQPTLPSALVQQCLLVLQVGSWHQSHHLAQLRKQKQI